MTANITKGNGEVVHWSKYRGQKEDKWTNQDYISLRKEFVSNITDRFEPDLYPENFPNVNFEDKPLYGMYKDDTTDVQDGLVGNTEDDEDPATATGLDRELPTPEANDNYVNAQVIFPVVNSYARWKVIGRKRYADGNNVGRKNDNPILETRKYPVEFDDGEVIKMRANVIEESMYAACDDFGNQ